MTSGPGCYTFCLINFIVINILMRSLLIQAIKFLYQLNRTQVMITMTNISDLIRPERLDIGGKLYFLENNYSTDKIFYDADEIYRDSINRLTLGKFEEEGSFKAVYNDYVTAFKETFRSIKNNGFKEDYAVPVVSNIITGGAHRLSSATFLGLDKIPTVICRAVDPPCYDYNFCKKRYERLYALLHDARPPSVHRRYEGRSFVAEREGI